MLSLFRLLAFWPILTLWCAAVITGVLWLLRDWSRLSFALPSRPLAATEWIMGGGLLSLLVSAVVSGLLCPPNSWDVMVYHLPRQIFWIQQFSVEHFPTHLLLQLYREPFAEFVGTHLLILTGTDYSLSFIQWFALTGCLAAVSLIAEQLGCDRQGQLFASLFVTTIPIIYLEAANAKNDLVFGLWYIILAWLALSVYQERRCRFSTALLIGCALGLLVLTKGAAYLLGLPLLIFTGLAIFRAARHLAWKPLVVIALTALALNFGHYARNYGLFGSPLGPEEAQEKFLNEAWSPALLLSRLVRESSLQMGTPIEELNRALEGSIEKLHEFLGIDINDPRSTVRLRNFAVLSRFENEYQAPAPLHLALVGLLLIFSFAFRRNIEHRVFWLLLAVPILGFILLTGVAKWEPDLNRRLHIPIFLLFAPLVAHAFSHGRMRRTVLPVTLVLLLGMATTLLWNPRSLIGPALAFRSENALLFTFQPDLQGSYEAAANYSRSGWKHTLGLHIEGNRLYQYPLMRLLRENLYEPTFVPINVDNVSRKLQSNHRPPDLVVSLSPQTDMTDSSTGQKYLLGKRFESVTVMLREGSASPASQK